ncbi:hypothetical protein BV22DRAFT_1033023 [Leucogyrophana mollusca]|uniref:Uncharacterized protein n=1 Tax=Leucogyrophana mollusca TaxID=85980 RepID=A0ACB8BL66_9AGAM|nr:hypothetical protein BV22DRAFT_1033023 [Leucogyrophana mollusca]
MSIQDGDGSAVGHEPSLELVSAEDVALDMDGYETDGDLDESDSEDGFDVDSDSEEV